MPKLYIPEIGDEITLKSDWTFDLYPESRNYDLGKLFGHYLHGYPEKWIDEKVVPEMREVDYKVNYPSHDDFYKLFKGYNHEKYEEACRKAEEACPEYVQYYKDHKEWSDKCKEIGKEKLSITIPAGSILKVDRIYIRKGAKDFSSITFYVRGFGEITRTEIWTKRKSTRKSLRFWAKLADCNTIEFI
jgi:hypothetical protein